MISSLGFTGRLIANALAVQERLSLAQTQAASGHRAESWGGYAPQARALIDVNTGIARHGAYIAAIDLVGPRLETVQTVLTRMDTLVGDLRKRALAAIGTGPVDLAAIRAEALSALGEIATMLNTDTGGRYVFGGSDNTSPPIPAGQAIAGGAGGPSLFGDIAARLATLDGTPGNTLADVWADLTAYAADDAAGRTIFSAALSAPGPGGIQDEPAPTALVADGHRIAVGLHTPAFKDPALAAADPNSTGSWLRDLIRDLMVLATLPESAGTTGELAGLMRNVADSLDATQTRLNGDASAMGTAQATLASVHDRHTQTVDMLKAHRGDLQDADLTEVSARIALLRTQLESSWALLARLEELSLARFI